MSCYIRMGGVHFVYTKTLCLAPQWRAQTLGGLGVRKGFMVLLRDLITNFPYLQWLVQWPEAAEFGHEPCYMDVIFVHSAFYSKHSLGHETESSAYRAASWPRECLEYYLVDCGMYKDHSCSNSASANNTAPMYLYIKLLVPAGPSVDICKLPYYHGMILLHCLAEGENFV